ncbi:muscle M-line assembly protein unc-89-like isoform X2 [Euwallacea fornicatus]|uniref:muscle M-line assembly protein unc-89-like isoform X2 n=1 Tax=Euwallacea fornicatus TaxID=995702 RepID=UPI00338FE92C
MSATVGAHSGTGPLSLMSCVRESSPLQDFEQEKNVSKRKFWNPKKWFRKKQKTGEDIVVHSHSHHHPEQRDVDGNRSRSTGELSTDEEIPPRSHHEVRNSASMHPGLSVSHDSVFHPLNSGSSDLELEGAQSSSSLSVSQPLGDAKLQTELSSKLRLRRAGRGDTSEDDEGLPRSPPCGSPAAATDSFLILEKTANHKDLPTKSHSTCSDGSLLSMDGSEMDEDSVGPQSRHSSRVSLNEKQESDLEFDFSTTPLNHSAAHHRVSVRPKRTYGAPRRKNGQLSSALPATPEVNEDSSVRSVSPESVTTEPITDLYSSSVRNLHNSTLVPSEVKLKCNSLPAGVVPPSSSSFRLSRSKSNAGKSQDDSLRNEELREERVSLFERLFPRRSGKKKKKEVVKMEVDSGRTSLSEEKKVFSTTQIKQTVWSQTQIKPSVAPRTGAASRQRIQPIDIPASPKEHRSSVQMTQEVSPLEPSVLQSPPLQSSPIQTELENLLKQRQLVPKDTPLPIKLSPPLVTTTYSSETKTTTEDIRNKIKIAGLSSLQQRVLTLNSEEDFSCKSLTDPPKPARALAKSHSFKSRIKEDKPQEEPDNMAERRKSITKASSLDSVKDLEEPVKRSELKLILKPVETYRETVEEIEVATTKTTQENTILKQKAFNTITITGPSHTAIVNVISGKSESFSSVTSEKTSVESEDEKKHITKDSQVSITKIQLKQETKSHVPEFMNKQLNKVEVRPSSNIIFSMKSPRISPESSPLRPKTLFNFPSGEVSKMSRKFSKDDVEIIENNPEVKDVSPPKTPPVVATTPTTPTRFKKNDSKPSSRKSSVISITSPESPPVKVSSRDRAMKMRSISLDSLKTEEKLDISTPDKSSQDSLDKRASDGVVLRRKSFAKQKNEEEPELMKVFARRSLKLRDEDIGHLQEAIADERRQRDSDKENNSETTPKAEKKSIIKETKEEVKSNKLPLMELKKSPELIKNLVKEEPEVQLRKSLNNNVFLATQRAASLNMPKTIVTDFHIKKQASLNERRRTEQWITPKKAESIEEVKTDTEIIIATDSVKEEVRTETKKNFSQRRAEWEKRVQQAQK